MPILSWSNGPAITTSRCATGVVNTAQSNISGGGAIVYTIQDASIATIDRVTGFIKPLKAGQTTVTASQEEAEANAAASISYDLTITATIPQLTWQINWTSDVYTAQVGGIFKNPARTTEGTPAPIVYTIDNTSLASIDATTGEVTPTATGIVNVSARLDCTTIKYKLTIIECEYYAFMIVAGRIFKYGVQSTGNAIDLTSLNAITLGSSFRSIVATPDEKYIYLTRFGDRQVLPFRVDNYGELTALAPSPSYEGDFKSITMSKDGKFMYVLSWNQNYQGMISQYNIAADGTLTALTPFTAEAGNSPQTLIVSPDGKFAYTNNAASTTGFIRQYKIDNGKVTLNGLPITDPVRFGPWAMAITTDSKYFYVSNGYSTSDPDVIKRFKILGDGTLSLVAEQLASGMYIGSFVTTPDGKYIYADNKLPGLGRTSQYKIEADGSLTNLLPNINLPEASAIAIDNTSKYMFVAVQEHPFVFSAAIGTDGRLTARYNNSTQNPFIGSSFGIAIVKKKP